MRIALSVPASNSRGPQYMEQALAALRPALPRGEALILECLRHAGEVTLAFRVPESLRGLVEGQLYAQYPETRLHALPAERQVTGQQSWTTDLHLHPDLFPLKRHPQFDDQVNRATADPLTGILALLVPPSGCPLDACVSLSVTAAPPRLVRKARRRLERFAGPFFRSHHRLAHCYAAWSGSPSVGVRLAGWLLGRLAREKWHPDVHTLSPGLHHDREADVQAAADKLGRPLFLGHLRLTVTAPPEAEESARAMLRALAGAFGQFHLPRLASFKVHHAGRRPRRFLVSDEEVATLWHPGTATVQAPTLAQVESRELTPPTFLPTRRDHTDLAVLGQAVFRAKAQRFGILPDDRRRHLAIVGKTGMGKTTLLQQLLTSDIRAGRGVALIDPHGDLCDAILAAIPSHRTNEVVLFDATDTSHPIAFNIFHWRGTHDRALTASAIIAAFKKIWGDFFGPRMEHVFRNALLALLEVEGSTLISLVRLLSEAKFREHLAARISDPVVRHYWQSEFAAMPPKFQAEVVSPVQNKVGQIVSSPLLRSILGQSRSTLDLRDVMDEGKLLLVNLSKGRIGEDASALLGSLLVNAVQLTAMSRADTAEADRPDFFLYIDEFQNFATASFATILSEARKFRLALTVAHQYLDQLDEGTAAAIFGNVGTLVSFQVGPTDAEPLAVQFGPELSPHDLLRLPRYQAYVRLLVAGQPSRPFSMRTLPPQGTIDARRAEIIRAVSRRRYARPAAEVEREIATALTA